MSLLLATDLGWPFWVILVVLFVVMAIPSVILPVWAHFTGHDKWPPDGE